MKARPVAMRCRIRLASRSILPCPLELIQLRHAHRRTHQRCAGDDVAVERHQRNTFTRRYPDVERVRRPQTCCGDNATDYTNDTRADGHEISRRKVSVEELRHTCGLCPTTNERGYDLDVEDGGYDDVVAASKERQAQLQRGCVSGLACTQGRDRNGRIEHVPHASAPAGEKIGNGRDVGLQRAQLPHEASDAFQRFTLARGLSAALGFSDVDRNDRCGGLAVAQDQYPLVVMLRGIHELREMCFRIGERRLAHMTNMTNRRHAVQ